MKMQHTPIKLESLGHMPVEHINTEMLDAIRRVAIGATAVSLQNLDVARKGAAERDGWFQRVMGFITGRAKAIPGVPVHDDRAASAALQEKVPSDEVEKQCIHKVRSNVSVAFVRGLLGPDYVTPTITNPRHLHCLYLLMKAPQGTGISREALDIQVGTSNSPACVDILRNQKLAGYGKMIESEKRKIVVDGKKKLRGYYWMTHVGRLAALDILASAGYAHDLVAAERHKLRLEIDRQRLIATFACDDEARSAVLDNGRTHAERLVSLLLWKQGWISRHDIERLIDAANLPDVVKWINNRFDCKVIESTRSPMLDRDGKSCRVGYYRIAPDSVPTMEAVSRWL